MVCMQGHGGRSEPVWTRERGSFYTTADVFYRRLLMMIILVFEDSKTSLECRDDDCE